MVSLRMVSLAAMLAFAAAAPASADWSNGGATAKKPPAQSIPIPEPADFALFAAGVVGLVLGRRGSRSRKRRDESDEDK